MNVKEAIYVQKEDEYARFLRPLIPSVDPDTILGVRIPFLRKLAKTVANTEEGNAFLNELPHAYFEENILHAVLLSYIKSADECLEALERFLPYIDNWSVCDTIKPKALAKDNALFLSRIKEWLKSGHTYTCRLGIKMLMDYYLGENYDPGLVPLPSRIRSEEYYVNMMIAWYYATALAKRWDDAIRILEGNLLPTWVHNKTIQKARESFRVSEEQKDYLKSLKRQ